MGREPGRSYKMSLDLALKDGLNLGARRRKGHDVRKGRDGGRRVCTNAEDRGAEGRLGNQLPECDSEASPLQVWE